MKTSSKAVNKRAKQIFENHIRRFRGHLIIETGQPGNRAEVYQWNGIRIHVIGAHRSDDIILPKNFIERESARCDVSAVVNVATGEVCYISPANLHQCRTYSNAYPDGTNNAKLETIFSVGKQHPLAAI